MLILTYKNRTIVKTITLKDKDGTAITLGSGDVIRVKIGYAGSAPRLDIDSVAATANGSSLTAANPTTLVLQQSDLNGLTPGTYDLEVDLVDHSQNNWIKMAEKGILIVEQTQSGDVGLT